MRATIQEGRSAIRLGKDHRLAVQAAALVVLVREVLLQMQSMRRSVAHEVVQFFMNNRAVRRPALANVALGSPPEVTPGGGERPLWRGLRTLVETPLNDRNWPISVIGGCSVGGTARGLVPAHPISDVWNWGD